jgi:hypothetical protein
MGCEQGCGGCPLVDRCRGGGLKKKEDEIPSSVKVEFGSDSRFNYVPEALQLWEVAEKPKDELKEIYRCSHGFPKDMCPYAGCANHKMTMVYEKEVEYNEKH